MSLTKNARTAPTIGRLASYAFAACAALVLTACGGSSSDDALPVGEPIAHVAPPAGQQWAEVASETPEGGVIIGNPNAPLKLMEYASHTCSHCADFSEKASVPLRDKYVASGVLSYELRNQIHDPIDLTVAMLARCSGPQSFHPLTEQLWANLGPVFERVQASGDALAQASALPEDQRYQAIADVSGLLDFFAARGISRDQAMQCLADPAKATAFVERSTKQSNELDVTGTPTFFLNGENIGTHTWETLEPILQKAGAR
jgi:protein-disulfide isomerase